MNKEILNEQLTNLEARNPGLIVLGPTGLTAVESADHMISLLQAMYVENGITKNKEKFVSYISKGNVAIEAEDIDELNRCTDELIDLLPIEDHHDTYAGLTR